MDTAVWHLKEYARTVHGLTNAVQLQAFIKVRLGVIVTVQTLRSLLRSQPPAPRREMIQLLCDAFNCRSSAFYVFSPDKARAERWEKDRSEGKKPMTLHQVKVIDFEETAFVSRPAELESSEKAKSLSATFTDPRTLYKDKLKS